MELLEEIDRPETEPFTGEQEAPALEPEAPVAPEKTAAPEPDKPPEVLPAPKEAERVVPLATLLEERRRYEARLKEVQDKAAKPPEGKPEPDKPVIDYTQDPKGYVDERVGKALHELESLKKQGTEQLEKTGQTMAEIQLTNAIAAAEAQAASHLPDYLEALNHVRRVRLQQLQLVNPEATAEQIEAHLGQEERQMAAAELAKNRNPYALIYEVAKTFGYAPAKPKADPALLTPEPKKANSGALAPDLTLGKTGGAAPETSAGEEDESEDDILTAAFSERFGKKRA